MSSAAYRPLDGASPAQDDLSEEGSAGMRSSVASLMNTILGTGLLAMAHAVAAGGIVPGILTILLSGGMAALGLHLLAMCAQRAPYRQSSFFELSVLTFPKAAVVFDAAIAIKCFGVAISYLIILGSLIPRVVVSFAADPADMPRLLVNRTFWIILCVAGLSPLCFLRKLHSLRFISYFAMVAVVDLLLVVLIEGLFRPSLPDRGSVDVFRFSSALVSSLPVYVFAYTCAQNLHSVHNELQNNTSSRMNAVVSISIGSSAVLYLLVGVVGYLTFGNKVSANILEMFPHSFLTNQCRFMIVFFVLFSYPLQIHPCRASVDKVITALVPRSPALETNSDTSGVAPGAIPSFRFGVITVCLLFLTTLVAVVVSSLEAVLGIVGATGSTTISFLLPATFYLKLYPASSHTSRVDYWRRVGARALLVLGGLIMVVALALNIAEWIHPHKVPGRGSGKHRDDPGHAVDDLIVVRHWH